MWQRWRTQHSIHHSPKPLATHKLHCSTVYRTRLIAHRNLFLHCRNQEFCAFCSCGLDLMTFIYEPDPYRREMHPQIKNKLSPPEEQVVSKMCLIRQSNYWQPRSQQSRENSFSQNLTHNRQAPVKTQNGSIPLTDARL